MVIGADCIDSCKSKCIIEIKIKWYKMLVTKLYVRYLSFLLLPSFARLFLFLSAFGLLLKKYISLHILLVMVFNATFNNISVISWQSVLLVGKTRVPGENQRPSASHLLIWSSMLNKNHNKACLNHFSPLSWIFIISKYYLYQL